MFATVLGEGNSILVTKVFLNNEPCMLHNHGMCYIALLLKGEQWHLGEDGVVSTHMTI